ncbi:TagK domain-containing protein [Paraburkholderia lycopersici]|uniref:TagK domain-containing protein n=1 Tax=Paraburkholderia lycopersici TaxID=416944 RepID=A0A1G7CW44_9BURK|nr:TagK domain-containing protein [Paraburkholderia lycopersici]SDE42856.1 hypothetical protein SAMN05421548_1488 [Paraburkholderia lycopersici]
MHLFRLLRRRESSVTRAEPGALPAQDIVGHTGTGMPDADNADNDTLATFTEHQPEGDLRGSEAIFALLGSRLVLEQDSSRPARVDADNLLSSLHRQYCQALDNPPGTVGGPEWESPSGSPGRRAGGESDLPACPHLHNAGQDSIEALLSGAQLLDHAFGPLRESDLGNLPESEPVPEILRVFAPPEYLASAFRSVAALPPTLTRREHHSPGIDSPLPMPEVTLTGNSP